MPTGQPANDGSLIKRQDDTCPDCGAATIFEEHLDNGFVSKTTVRCPNCNWEKLCA